MKLLKNTWFAWTAVVCLALLMTNQSVSAQSDCGCNQPATAQGYSLDNYGASPCGNGCGSGTFMSRLRNAFSCDSKFRPGLWDGYCDGRMACDRSLPSFGGFGCATGCGGAAATGCGEAATTGDCGGAAQGCGGCGGGCNIFGTRHFGGCSLRRNCGLHRGLRMFHFPQAAGCGSGAYGISHGCGCGDEPAVAKTGCDGGCGTGGCGSGGCGIFGSAHSCFRNDGHFFGCMSRHGHRHGLFSGRHSCGCNLFSGLLGHGRQGGSFGCGHCQNGCGMESYEVGCGTDNVEAAPGAPAPATESAPATETVPAIDAAPAAVSG